MTIAADIATIGSYDTTDISNAVTQAFAILTIHYGSTLAEGTNTDWDIIAKIYAVYLLDRLDMQERSKTDPSVQPPPLMSEEVRQLINRLKTEPESKSTLIVTSFSSPGYTFTTSDTASWYDPEG